jgi:hypothetical protein
MVAGAAGVVAPEGFAGFDTFGGGPGVGGTISLGPVSGGS